MMFRISDNFFAPARLFMKFARASSEILSLLPSISLSSSIRLVNCRERAVRISDSDEIRSSASKVMFSISPNATMKRPMSVTQFFRSVSPSGPKNNFSIFLRSFRVAICCFDRSNKGIRQTLRAQTLSVRPRRIETDKFRLGKGHGFEARYAAKARGKRKIVGP